jgi:hypothetical protein
MSKMATRQPYQEIPNTVTPRLNPGNEVEAQQEAERRTGIAKYSLGSALVAILLVFFCGLIISQYPASRKPITVILIVAFFALRFATKKIMRAAQQKNLTKVLSERRNALNQTDQEREDQAAPKEPKPSS